MPEANSPLIIFLGIAPRLPEAGKQAFKHLGRRHGTGSFNLIERNLAKDANGNNPWTDFIGK